MTEHLDLPAPQVRERIARGASGWPVLVLSSLVALTAAAIVSLRADQGGSAVAFDDDEIGLLGQTPGGGRRLARRGHADRGRGAADRRSVRPAKPRRHGDTEK